MASNRKLLRCWVSLGTSSPLFSKLAIFLEKKAKLHKAPVVRAERQYLDSLAKNGVHQGVCAEFESLPPLVDLPFGVAPEHIMPLIVGSPPLLLALDNVTDMNNIGAIIRSALLLGVDGLVMPKGSPALDARAAKTSAGASEIMLASGRVHSCGGFSTWLAAAGAAGWRVLGAVSPMTPSMRQGVSVIPLRSLSRDCPTILVLGSEGSGLRESVHSSCTHFVSIEMCGSLTALSPGSFDKDAVGLVDSLNVSVAAGLLMNRLAPS